MPLRKIVVTIDHLAIPEGFTREQMTRSIARELGARSMAELGGRKESRSVSVDRIQVEPVEGASLPAPRVSEAIHHVVTKRPMKLGSSQ